MGFKFSTAKTADEEKRNIQLGKQQGEIVATSATTSSNGNAMLTVRVRIDSGPDADKELYGTLTFSDGMFAAIERFVAALDRDPEIEFGDQAIDEAFLNNWRETLIGERIGFKVRMSSGYTNADGDVSPPRPEINPFAWYAYVPGLDTSESLL